MTSLYYDVFFLTLFVFLNVAVVVVFVVFLAGVVTSVSVTLTAGAVLITGVVVAVSISTTCAVLSGVVASTPPFAGCVECFPLNLAEALILRFLPIIGAPCVYSK